MAAGVKAGELRELSEEELVARLREAKAELFNLRVQGATGQLDNNRRLQVVRRDIARIYTIMRERELGLSVAPDEVASIRASDKQLIRPRTPPRSRGPVARRVRASWSATR